jgi:hypothetical protein
MNEYFPDRQLYPLQRERLREKEPQANCANPQKRGEREWAGCVGGILHGPMVGVKVNLMEASEKSKLPPFRSKDKERWSLTSLHHSKFAEQSLLQTGNSTR